MSEAIPIFAAMLKQWRTHRSLSQLELATRSGVSQRHISFLETGRANPSRPMVLALANCLDVPLRERNGLLQSAGFAAAYQEGDLDDSSYRVFKQAIQQTIEHQEPYPAMVLDGRWNLMLANQAALKFFAHFVDPLEALVDMGNPQEFQMVRLCLHDKGLRPFIVNWQELVASFLHRARRGLLANPKDPLLPIIVEEILDHPAAPDDWRNVWSMHPNPALEMVLQNHGKTYRLFTMLAHFGTPADITLEEVSLELFYPADDATREFLEALADC